jgi:hypothetical protein
MIVGLEKQVYNLFHFFLWSPFKSDMQPDPKLQIHLVIPLNYIQRLQVP